MIDLHKHLVEVPAPVAKAFHPADAFPADFGGEHRSPETHRFMANIDAAFKEQIRDVA